MHMLSANSPRGRTLAWVIIGDFVRNARRWSGFSSHWKGKFYYIVVSLKERGGGVLNFVKSQKAAK